MVSNIVLVIILFDGGLCIWLVIFCLVLKLVFSLVIVGVMLFVLLVGVFVIWLMDVDWCLGLLLGGIIGFIDVVVVFNVVKGVGVIINEWVVSILEIEFGLNDFMVIFIILMLVGVMMNFEVSFGWEMFIILV